MLKSKKTLKNIIKIAFTVVFALTAILNVAVMLTADGQGFSFINLALLKINGGSMQPQMYEGDMAIITRAPYDTLAQGDVITFVSNGGYVTHEIVSAKSGVIVTKGTANAINDRPITQNEYVGKVVANVRNGAAIYDCLTSPIVFALCVLAIVTIFFGKSIVEAIFTKSHVNIFAGKSVRIAAVFAIVSVLAVTPFLSAAKFVSSIYAYDYAVAEEVHFESNILVEGGHTSSLRGWNGSGYDVTVAIYNFENELLYNELGTDVIYTVYAEKTSSNGTDGDKQFFTEDYEVTVTPSADIPEECIIENVADDEWADGLPVVKIMGAEGPVSQNFNVNIAAHDDDANPETQAFLPKQQPVRAGEDGMFVYEYTSGDPATTSLVYKDEATGLYYDGYADGKQVVDTSEGTLKQKTENTKICFMVYAETSSKTGYYRKLWCEFVFEVAQEDNFLGVTQLSSAAGSTLVTYEIKTNLIAGFGTKDVIVTWDADYLYLNEYQKLNGKYIDDYVDLEVPANNKYFKEVEYEDGAGTTRHKGYIILSLEAYSYVTLEFFKKNVAYVCSEDDIVAELYEPEEPPVVNPPVEDPPIE